MNLIIEKAVPADYQMFADIIQSVWDGMEQKDWFMADNADYTYEMLSSRQGCGYKAVDRDTGKTAGVFMTVIPGLDESNLGYDIGFTREQLLKTAHMDSVAILPEYRGQRLQCRLMQEAEKDLKEQGIVLGKRKKNDVPEECRFAYKDIDVVMAQQSELVTPIRKLKTVGVVKG